MTIAIILIKLDIDSKKSKLIQNYNNIILLILLNKMKKKIFKLGVIYKKTNPWWRIDYLQTVLKQFNNVSVKLLDVSDLKFFTIPDDLDFITMVPAEHEIVTDFIEKNLNLKWIHCMWAGVDKFLSKKEIMKNDNIILTNARGAYADSLSEFSIFSMLYFSFNYNTYLKAFQQRKWTQPVNENISKKTLTIVGYGLNGVQTAKKAKLGFDMKVIGIKKNIINFPGKEYLDEIHSLSNLDEILPRSDFVINILPHTIETIDLFNYDKFKKMKRTGVFINIGRGSAVEEDDLIKALKEKLILGAALDVFKTEPLSSNSPFYDLDNVLLSFHSADNTDQYFNQGVEVFIKNLESYITNKHIIL